MTQDEIIAMAREAGFRTGHINMSAGDPLPFIAPISATSCIVEVQRLIELAAAKEREACAEIAEKEDVASTDDPFGVQSCIADAIRARGQKEGA